MRRPRTREAYWIGIRRWPSWMKMITVTATIAMITNTAIDVRFGLLTMFATAAGACEQVQELEDRVALEEDVELLAIDARDGHDGQEPEDDQDPQDVEDPTP